jgi:hypothetical protein
MNSLQQIGSKNQQRGDGIKPIQLSLLEAPPAVHGIGVKPAVSAIHDIGVESVLFHLCLGSDRVWIVITRSIEQEKIRFQLPVQWTRSEAATLLHQIRGISWQLGEDGYPIHLKQIIGICEHFCQSTRARMAV